MNWKACFAGVLACSLAGGVARAADLPSVKAATAYAPPPAAFTWEGWHLGVVGGYGGGSFASTSTIYTPASATWLNQSVGTSGWLVGYETGYTWQFSNNFVVGYESDFSYADVSSSTHAGAPGVRLEWFGSERLRFGYALDRVLPYITGGLAYGRTKTDGVQAFGGFLFPSNGSIWQAGWTVGAGVEYAVMGNISVKAEYLFTHMKGPNAFGAGVPSGFRIAEGRDFDTHLARVGANFHFEGPMKLLDLVGLRF